MRKDETIQTEGNVSYYASRSAVVCVQTPFVRKKICRVEFSKRDGSIMVPFPYLSAKRGVLSNVVNLPPEGGPYQYDLVQDGVVVEYDVKFNHHRSGIAQFSKDGPNDKLPRRRVFPLEGTGKVFELHVQSLTGLDWVAKPGKHDLLLNFAFGDEHPLGICLHGEWWRKSEVAVRSWPPGSMVGPRSNAMDRKTGVATRFAFLGAPKGFPLTDHVLLLSIRAVPPAEGPAIPTMAFLGAVTTRACQESYGEMPGFLAFLYPYTGAVGRPPERKPANARSLGRSQ
jgi:hypothetical protein